MNSRYLAAAAAAALLLGAASASSAAGAGDLVAPSYGAWGFDLAGRDTAAKPGDDFFEYANGAYIAKTEIPADRSWYGTINKLRDLSEQRVHAILEDAAATAPAPPAT